MVISQVHDSYVYVQESQERAVKVKMEEVEERVASVKDQFTQEIRMEDRKTANPGLRTERPSIRNACTTWPWAVSARAKN